MKYDFDKIIDRTGTGSVKWELAEELFGQSGLLPLWVADMDFECPIEITQALQKRVGHPIFGYTFQMDSYYAALLNWLDRRHNWKIQKDWVVSTPGIIPALNLLVRTFSNPGEKIIIQPPVYYPFSEAIKNNGRQPLFNQLIDKDGRYEINFKDLEEKAKDPLARVMILCSPHNPVGKVWKKSELEKIARICIDNDVLIISDEIHQDLVYKPHSHLPLASISSEFSGHSITCTAPSKTFNLAGLQCSNLIIPNQNLREKFQHTLNSTGILGLNSFAVVALEAAYNKGEDWLEQLLEYLEENIKFIEAFIKEKMPEIKFIKPEGTYLAWLDFSALKKSPAELEEIMLKKAKVALDEGYIFGSGGEGYERINFACPRSVLKDCLEKIEKVIH